MTHQPPREPSGYGSQNRVASTTSEKREPHYARNERVKRQGSGFCRAARCTASVAQRSEDPARIDRARPCVLSLLSLFRGRASVIFSSTAARLPYSRAVLACVLYLVKTLINALLT